MMSHQFSAVILIAATLLAQCAPGSEPGSVLPPPTEAGGHSNGAEHQVLPGGLQPVAALRLITSQTIRLGRTERTPDEADPTRLLPAAAALSPPGYLLRGGELRGGFAPGDLFCGHAVDRNPPLRL